MEICLFRSCLVNVFVVIGLFLAHRLLSSRSSAAERQVAAARMRIKSDKGVFLSSCIIF